MSSAAQQFGRVCTLVVSNAAAQGLDLSKLRIKFTVKRSGVMTPNIADIRVYNLEAGTAAIIKKEFTQVTLQAGYVGNYGVIFKGNIKQVIIGRESATDTFVDIIAGDGDQAYNYAIINTTQAAGSTQGTHLNAALSQMSGQGVTQGYVAPLSPSQLPRGKVMYGKASDHIQKIAQNANCAWSIQDGKVIFLSLSTYLNGTAVILSSKTGMIGTPRQTVEGINFQCLLNPKLKIHGRVQVDNASVAQYQLNQFVPGSAANTPVPLTYDGVYYIFIAEHEGDTRGGPWYTNLVTLNIDPSSNPLNGVGSL